MSIAAAHVLLRAEAMVAAKPSDRPGKPPLYVFLALAAAWSYGGCGAYDGCSTIRGYHTQIDIARQTTDIADNAARAAMVEELARYVSIADAARGRVFPLSAAELVLGLALVVFSWSAMVRRANARAIVVQLVGAYAVLGIVAYVLTPDVRAATIDVITTLMTASPRGDGRASLPFNPGHARTLAQLAASLALALRTLISLLIIIALTRPRARAVLDGARDAISRG